MTPKHLAVLRTLILQLKDCPINWAITGSLGFWLQGINLEVNDIDVQTDETGAYQIEREFREFVVKPVEFSSAERIRSHFGALHMGGMTVEIMGDIQKRNLDGSWDMPVDLRKYKRYVEVEGLPIPVLSLTYEYEAYLKMGRLEKAKMLSEWLHGR